MRNKLSETQLITPFLLDVFISFTEFPTCEPLTQFACKSGRCISSKWHCDSGKYQMFTRLCTDLIGGLAGCAASPLSEVVRERRLQSWAKWPRQVVRGQLARHWGLALRKMELNIRPLGLWWRFVLRCYAGHSLSLQTWSESNNWGNDLDNSGSPKHLCKMLCNLRME